MTDQSFHNEVKRAIASYEQENKRYANRTRQMIAKYGEIEALSRLMINADLQMGFQTLRDAGYLDKTFEAVVVRFPDKFKPDVVEAAQWRLDHPYQLL